MRHNINVSWQIYFAIKVDGHNKWRYKNSVDVFFKFCGLFRKTKYLEKKIHIELVTSANHCKSGKLN